MRLIDADDLTDRLETFMEWENATFVQHEIDASPTIDPVKHGRWKERFKVYECSVCGETAPFEVDYNGNVLSAERFSYCPFCGAKMEVIDESNTD